MKRETLQQWAKRFVADLAVDGEDVSFEGTVRKHIHAILEFRTERLKSKSLVNAITKAGGRREDNQPYSEGQFRVAVSHIKGEMKASTGLTARPPQSRVQRSAAVRPAKPRHTPPEALSDLQFRSPRKSPGEYASTPSAVSKVDVSVDEITTALSRLNRLK